jgi:hypothetical protein
MMTGVERFIQNSFSDQEKHDCIKLILNEHAG